MCRSFPLSDIQNPLVALAARLGTAEWDAIGVGTPESWPQTLRAAVQLCQVAGTPTAVCCGPDFAVLGNAAFLEFFPNTFGVSAADCWAPVWSSLKRDVERVRSSGKALSSDDLRLLIARNLPNEEVYLRFHLTPLAGESGHIEAIFCSCTETTREVIEARRRRLLRTLATRAREAKSAQHAIQEMAVVLSSSPLDLPYAAIYASSDSNGGAQRLAVSNVNEDDPRFPKELHTASQRAGLPPAIPLIGPGRTPVGLWFAGVSHSIVVDDGYETFLDLISLQLAVAVANLRIERLGSTEPRNVPANESRFRAIVDQSVAGIVETGLGGNVELANDRACTITGYSRQELIGRSILDITHPDDVPQSRILLERLMSEYKPFTIEKRYQRKDGSVVWVNNAVSLTTDPESGEHRVVAIIIDITEKKRAESELRFLMREREGHLAILQTLLTAAPIGIAFLDSECRFVLVSDAACSGNGLPRSEHYGRRVSDVMHFGEEFEGLARRVIETRQPIAGIELRGRAQPAAEERHWLASCYPVQTTAGELLGVGAIWLDITDRKLAEQQIVAQASRLARSNEELQHFAYSASHDLQEPLRTVQVFIDLLQRSLQAPSEEVRHHLGLISEAASHMAMLISNLLEFAKAGDISPDHFERVEMNAVVGIVIKNVQAAILDSGAVIEAEELPAVMAHPDQVTRVIQNLVTNSIRYRRHQEPPVLRISAEQDRSAREILFVVSDNGVGFDSSYARTVFDPFKRLHGKSQPGTGLGLAICKRIIERHGGRIWAESQPGDGARFYFTLPAAEAEEHKAQGSS